MIAERSASASFPAGEDRAGRRLGGGVAGAVRRTWVSALRPHSGEQGEGENRAIRDERFGLHQVQHPAEAGTWPRPRAETGHPGRLASAVHGLTRCRVNPIPAESGQLRG